MRQENIRDVQLSLWPEEELTGTSSPAEELLGKAGRRFFTGKSMKPPTIFNATIFDEKGERIWFGDIDLRSERSMLLRLSVKIGAIFILNGIVVDFSASNKPSPWQIRKSAAAIVEEGKIFYSKAFALKVKAYSEQRNQTLKRRRALWRTNAELMF